MQIPNVLSQNHGSHARAKRTDGVQSAVASALKQITGGSSTASPADNTALGQIVAQYDVTKITPQQFSDMTQKLRKTGKLNDSELRELTQIRNDLDSSGAAPDQALNVVNFYQGKVQDLHQKLSQDAEDMPPAEQAAAQQSLASYQQRLSWMQKLAALHGNPGATSVDLTA